MKCHLVISRADAAAAGFKRYFTGEPCKAGHVSERSTHSGRCAECVKVRTLAWNAKNRARYLAYHSNYDKRRPASGPATKARRDKDREAFNASRRKYYEANKKRVMENTKRSAQRHIEKHRLRVNAKKRNRNALKASVGGTHTPKDIRGIFQAQRGRCGYCHISIAGGYHVDHIMPISKGGSNWPNNLQLLCADCNLQKAAKDPADFARQMGRLI